MFPLLFALPRAGLAAIGLVKGIYPLLWGAGQPITGRLSDTLGRKLSDAECAIAQALGVVGEWWTLLIVREVAGGRYRFDELHAELGLSRKILAERLRALVENRVLVKQLYCSRPPRYEYRLTLMGQGLLPVLVALQDWGRDSCLVTVR